MKDTDDGAEKLPEVLMVEITNSDARIRLPPPLIATLHGSHPDGWWPLGYLSIGNDEITARYNMNIVNVGSVRIDRHTGVISIDARAATFRGACQAITEERKF